MSIHCVYEVFSHIRSLILDRSDKSVLFFCGVFFLASGIFLYALFHPIPAAADERILNFHSSITVHEDASMNVRETIRVKSGGDKIRRGIYRDFPTRYRDHLGNSYIVGFTVQGVLRDGISEPFFTERISNGERVYIGQKDVFLDPGEYTYTIEYTTTRQIGFFRDHDELYWNVTGNGWEFPIESASASIILPGEARKHIIEMDGYTGPSGSQKKDFTVSLDPENIPFFSTTKTLAPLEGLTIVVSWKKGFVIEPEPVAKIQYFLSDNLHLLLIVFGFIVIVLYYFLVWAKFGRDPSAGVIVTRYAPPDDVSPAVIGFITRMGYDDKLFTSAIINLAVKGWIKIRENDGEYTLQKVENRKTPLSQDEILVLTTLMGAQHTITLEQANHQRIRSAIDKLKKYLTLNFEKRYFLTNFRYFFIGLLLTIILLFVSGVRESLSKGTLPVFLFICVWLSFWSLGVIALASSLIKKWKRVPSSRGGKKMVSAGRALFANLFALPFFAGELLGLGFLWYATSLSTIIVMILLLSINYIFYHLLKAPTRYGRSILDSIEGFKRFIVATEKDRLNMMNPPEKTPELFEKYLPYALALDIEQQWAEQFSDILSAAAVREGSTAYNPSWYLGSPFDTQTAGALVNSLSSSFSGAISSSSVAPGSSSGGGGGGSSGGGGGGGGGGGW